MRRHIIAIAFGCSSFFSVAVASAEIRYSVTDLGTLGTTSYGGVVNNEGSVVGSYYFAGSGQTGNFLYDGTMHDISNVGWVAAINNKGQMMGIYPSGIRSFIYDGVSHDIGTLGGNMTQAYGMNNSGEITGYSQTSTYDNRAFLYDGTMHDIGTLGAGHPSYGYGINDRGWVTGFSYTPQWETHAFLYDGTMHDIGTPGINSGGTAINASGEVTGTMSAPYGTHAFFYDGTMHDCGTLGGPTSYPYAINSAGQIVGDSSTAPGDGHAFLYDPVGGILDLNSLIDPNSGWVLWKGAGINDRGQISGSGTIGGQNHAFLLTPVPEPSGFILVASGLLTIAAMWRGVRPAAE